MAQQNTSNESELQNLLADERERCNQHKQLYQTLKEDYRKLQAELASVFEELQKTRLKNNATQESYENTIKKLEEQLHEKRREILKLSDLVRLYDPETIRNSVLEEAKNHYELKIKELHVDVDHRKEQFNALHYEHTVLRCKLESRESEHSHLVERLKVQHYSEVVELQNKIEMLEKQKSPADDTRIELKSAKHDILQLNAKVNGLLAECEELRAKNENLTLQLSSTNRINLKQLTDHMSTIRALESEKQNVVMQRDALEKELANSQEHRRIMNNDLQTCRREVLSLKSKLEECEHKCKVSTTNLQVEKEMLKNEYQSEREQLNDEITRLTSEASDVKAKLDHTVRILMSKEKELQQNSITAQHQIWKQTNDYHQEKEMNESNFQDFKNQKEQFISQLHNELQILQQNLQMCSNSKLELEKELLSMKQKLEEISNSSDAVAIEVISQKNLQYEQEINALREQINNLKSTNNSTHLGLGQQDKFLNDVVSRRKTDQENGEEREIFQLKLGWEQQKYQFHKRLEDLESQLKEAKNFYAAEKKELETRIQRYIRVGNRLKEKLDTQKAKNEELKNQKDMLEKNIPLEMYLQIRNRYDEQQKRLEEYRLLVIAEPHPSACARSPPAASEKLLTDIQNLQLRSPATGNALQEHEVVKHVVERTSEKSKKIHHPRRRSLKTRNRELLKTFSPIITSSSDLDLENL